MGMGFKSWELTHSHHSSTPHREHVLAELRGRPADQHESDQERRHCWPRWKYLGSKRRLPGQRRGVEEFTGSLRQHRRARHERSHYRGLSTCSSQQLTGLSGPRGEPPGSTASKLYKPLSCVCTRTPLCQNRPLQSRKSWENTSSLWATEGF